MARKGKTKSTKIEVESQKGKDYLQKNKDVKTITKMKKENHNPKTEKETLDFKDDSITLLDEKNKPA